MSALIPSIGCQHDDMDFRIGDMESSITPRADQADCRGAIHFRHAPIHQDEIKAAERQGFQRLLAILHKFSPMAHFFQKPLDDQLIWQKILGTKDL